MEVISQKHNQFSQDPLFIERDCESLYYDTTTWLAEVLPGSMHSEFSFAFDGEELYSKEGRPLRPVFDDAIEDAERTAEKHPNLSFEVDRRRVERLEYDAMLEMARGERSNTLVVVSDFPEELKKNATDVGGYNVKRQQTMLRVITRSEDGTITTCSQSLDGSDRTGLEAIYNRFGKQPEPGELLGQWIDPGDLDEYAQNRLITWLRDDYDSVLHKRDNQDYFAGRRIVDEITYDSTLEFVEKQQDLLQRLDHVTAGHDLDKFLYETAATMKARYEKFVRRSDISLPGNVVMLNQQSVTYQLEREVYMAARNSEANGEVFSGCGMSVSTGLEADSALRELGYGNKTDSESSYSFDKHTYCRVCQAPPETDEPKKMCGPCSICRDCDGKL